ncbi:DUF3592 domain-containing protein [Verrucomicrobiota bacterium]
MKLSFIAGRGCLVLLLCPFLIGGLWATKCGYGFVRDACLSTRWPKVRGRIESASVAARRAGSGAGRRSHPSRSYGASIVYTYQVEGTTYTCDRVFFGNYRSDRPDHAEAQKARYPPGREVDVYYDPDRPEVAVLEPGPKFSTSVVMIVGIVFTIVALAGIGVCLFAKSPESASTARGDMRPRLPP